MATKSKLTVPPVVKVGGSDEEEATVNPEKRSQVMYKLSKETETLTQMLAETEDSKHLGVGGISNLTPKQRAI